MLPLSLVLHKHIIADQIHVHFHTVSRCNLAVPFRCLSLLHISYYFTFYLLVGYVCMHAHKHTHAMDTYTTVCVWRCEHYLQDSVLPCVSPGIQAQAITFRDKHLYLLSHLASASLLNLLCSKLSWCVVSYALTPSQNGSPTSPSWCSHLSGNDSVSWGPGLQKCPASSLSHTLPILSKFLTGLTSKQSQNLRTSPRFHCYVTSQSKPRRSPYLWPPVVSFLKTFPGGSFGHQGS